MHFKFTAWIPYSPELVVTIAGSLHDPNCFDPVIVTRPFEIAACMAHALDFVTIGGSLQISKHIIIWSSSPNMTISPRDEWHTIVYKTVKRNITFSNFFGFLHVSRKFKCKFDPSVLTDIVCDNFIVWEDLK